MNITSNKINCYIEGIRVPIISFSSQYERNKISVAKIVIPIGNYIDAKMWGNAFIQVTYFDFDEYNTKREKLLYQGLCTSTIVYEEESKIEATLESLWGIFNFNSTLDYVAPKKYGIQNLSETVTLYVGNEAKIATPMLPPGDPTFNISNRYVFVDASKDISQMNYDDPDINKLEFIMQRIPFAERFAFSFFEQMAYSNFILTKAHVERFNLLNKVESSMRIEKAKTYTEEELAMTFGIPVLWDQSRTGFSHKEHEFDEKTQKFQTGNTASGNQPAGLANLIKEFGEAGTNIERFQCKCAAGGKLGWVEGNKKIKDIMIETFEDIEKQGLGKHIKSFDGMYNYREKNTRNGKSSSLSVHSWGVAFDINAKGNFTGTTEDQKILAPIIKKHGWYWGGDWEKTDSMHFQYCSGY